MLRRLSVLMLVSALPLAGAAVNREMQELQRDVAQLQDLVKSLQAAMTEKLAALQAQVQTSSATQANLAVTAVQRNLDQMVKDQQNKLLPPMVSLGTRMDQVSTGLGTMQQAVTDLASLMAKLQTQIGDLSNQVKVSASTPPPPPQVEEKPLPAATLFENATGDFRAGKLEIALQEFRDYLKFYQDTALASDAQYYVGSIHQSQNDLEAAVKDYDQLLTGFPDARKAPDAMYYKGKALYGLGRNSDGAEAWKELRKRFPNHDLAKQSLTARPSR